MIRVPEEHEERASEPRLRPALTPADTERIEQLIHLRRWRRDCEARVASPCARISWLALREWTSAQTLVREAEASIEAGR